MEFIVEQNDLNDHWMVYSEHPELPNCFSFKSRKAAEAAKDKLNEYLKDQKKEQ